MARSKTTKTRTTLTYETLPALFTGICNAIRAKTGGTDPINHQDIPASIEAIPTGKAIDVSTMTTPVVNNSYSSAYSITAAKSGLLTVFGTYLNADWNNVLASSVTINGTAATFSTKKIAGLGTANLTLGITCVKVTEGDVVVINHAGGVYHDYYYIEEV